MLSTTDKAKAVERANSYRQMMELWAWKELELFLENERKSALELAIVSEDLKDIQVNRGKVQQLDSIKSHLGYILGGGQVNGTH